MIIGCTELLWGEYQVLQVCQNNTLVHCPADSCVAYILVFQIGMHCCLLDHPNDKKHSPRGKTLAHFLAISGRDKWAFPFVECFFPSERHHQHVFCSVQQRNMSMFLD